MATLRESGHRPRLEYTQSVHPRVSGMESSNMSKIYVMDIVGTGIYEIPNSDLSLLSATNGMDSLLTVNPGIAQFTYTDIQAFVKDSATAGGGEGTRSLNLIIDGFVYKGTAVPDETVMDEMCTVIKVALKTNPGGEAQGLITDVGEIRVNEFADDPQ